MSSTNVHSKQNSNKYCASAQIIPITPEKGLEIPPKNSKPGPTRSVVKSEELAMKITSVGNYEIQKDGTVIDMNSNVRIGKVSMQQCNSNKQIRTQRAPSKYEHRENVESIR